MANFLHWNIDGVIANLEDLKLLLNYYCPKVFALQETLLSEDKNISFAGYHLYRTKYNNTCSDRGVALLISNSVAHSIVDLNTHIEAIAARVTVDNKTYTFCNIYLSPSKTFTRASIEDLFEQLPGPVVLMGDFNAHSPVWGSDTQSQRGKLLEKVFDLRNLCVLNDGSMTFLHRAYNTSSCLDLTVVDPAIVLDFKWSVLEDTHGSDHFPVLLTKVSMEEEDLPQRLNLNKADWPKFDHECRGRLREEAIFSEGSIPVESFTRVLMDIAEDCIPKSSISNKRTKVPWFNDECKLAKKKRKLALRRFRQAPTLANLLAFRSA